MNPSAILLAALGLTALATAQTPATYALYGQGCNGAVVTNCLSLNDANPAHQLASLPNEYAYPVVNTTGQAI